MVEAPQSFVVRGECDKAAWHHGFRRKSGEDRGWAAYEATTAQGTLYRSIWQPAVCRGRGMWRPTIQA